MICRWFCLAPVDPRHQESQKELSSLLAEVDLSLFSERFWTCRWCKDVHSKLAT